MNKEAISVYNPQDPVEAAIQNSYHDYSGEWLHSYPCRLLAKAITGLKCFQDDWLDNSKLLSQRMSYFFSPHLTEHKETMVFLTHPLYLRDIIENHEINAFLYYPVSFITPPLAYYLFREYPIHLYIDFSKIKSMNHGMKFTDVGGLCISENNVHIDIEAISSMRVMHKDEDSKKFANSFKKSVQSVSPGVFKIDSDIRKLKPQDRLWDKYHRREVIVDTIDPGESGSVVLHASGEDIIVSKEYFDQQYSLLEN